MGQSPHGAVAISVPKEHHVAVARTAVPQLA
jgi:hypothetical protein